MIATYNRCADLKECLTSIFALNTPPYEVIVVDSDSKDGTAMMQDLFPLQFISISERNRERALQEERLEAIYGLEWRRGQ